MGGGCGGGLGSGSFEVLGQCFCDFGGVLAQGEDICCAAQRVKVHVVAGIVAFALLLGCEGAGAVFEIFEGAEVAGFHVLWVLQRDDVFPAKVLFADEILPHLGFYVQPLDGVVGEDVAGVSERNDVRVVCEDFVGDWIHSLPIIIPREVELDQL